jgi:hypothetical protein
MSHVQAYLKPRSWFAQLSPLFADLPNPREYTRLPSRGACSEHGSRAQEKFAKISQLTQQPSRTAGLLWLLCSLILILAGSLFLFKQASWWWIVLPGIILSQVLIFLSWGDAKFGTVANLTILLPLTATALEARLRSYSGRYKVAVREGLNRCTEMPLVTEADLNGLPAPVQKYLRITGSVDKPRTQNFRATFTGDFRNGSKGSWMVFRSEQYDFFDQPTRLFLMKASTYGVPIEGLHIFRGDSATMQIKLASLLQVVDAKGPEMNRGETVTLFNDMCLLAPATLIDKGRIQWEADGPLAARARFTHRGNTIRAQLSFNQDGELIDFVSSDRFMSDDGKTFKSYPWSTPVRSYREFDGRKVASYGEVVWHTPEGDFTYGKFNLAEVKYNLGAE